MLPAGQNCVDNSLVLLATPKKEKAHLMPSLLPQVKVLMEFNKSI